MTGIPLVRFKAKVLLVVWGESYIDRFAALSLPCLLAPGNLPALASGCELEFLVLTTTRGAEYFQTHPELRRLHDCCPVRFIRIDDLVSEGVYGVTLTLAFTRGIADSGDEMTSTHFVFLNADFMLADGSLNSLLGHIRAGHGCVLAPSFRAIAEDVEPLFRALANSGGGVVAMPPREMVRISLDHLHSTTVAKTVNQSLLQTMHPNQFYWRVDADTMIGRFFLIFMLCIKPERTFGKANSFCDYGFVPEMCPSGRITVLSDSDDFFMLEAQGRFQESSHLCLGPQSPDGVIASLGEWTTKEHRFIADHDLVFHAKNLPSNIEQYKAAAARHIEGIKRALPPALGHENHAYWVNGLATWRAQRHRAGETSIPPEAAGHAPVMPTVVSAESHAPLSIPHSRTWRSIVRSWLVGKRPKLRVWHHEWADYRMLREELAALDAAGNDLLVAYARETPIASYFSRSRPQTSFATYKELEASRDSALERPVFSSIVCVITPRDLRWPGGRIFPTVLPFLRSGGQFFLVFHNLGEDTFPRDMRSELVRLAAQVPRDLLEHSASQYCGGSTKQLLRGALGLISVVFSRHGLAAILLASPILALLLIVSIFNNIQLSFLRDKSRYLDGCTSFVLHFQKR